MMHRLIEVAETIHFTAFISSNIYIYMYKVPIRILQHITVDHPVGPKQNLRGSQEEWNEKKERVF